MEPTLDFWDILVEVYQGGSGPELVDKCSVISGADTMEVMSQIQGFLSETLPALATQFSSFVSVDETAQKPTLVVLRTDTELLSRVDPRPADAANEALQPFEPLKRLEEFVEKLQDFLQERKNESARSADKSESELEELLRRPHKTSVQLSQAYFWKQMQIWVEFCDRYLRCKTAIFELNFRAAVWRLLLDITSGPSKHWARRYTYQIIPTIVDYVNVLNVSTSEIDTKTKFRSTIEADVIRSGFQEPEYRALLRRLLLTYVVENPRIGYAQEMSFVAAALVRAFTVSAGALRPPTASLKVVDMYTQDPSFVFVDVYVAMQKLFSHMRPLWVEVTRSGELEVTSKPLFRLGRDVMDIVALFDPELADVLKEMMMQEDMYFLLWQSKLSTLFAWVLEDPELFKLWDYLFASFHGTDANFLTKLKYLCAAHAIVHRGFFLEQYKTHPTLQLAQIGCLQDFTNRNWKPRKPISLTIKVCSDMLWIYKSSDPKLIHCKFKSVCDSL